MLQVEKMELFEVLSKEDRQRLVQLLDKKENNNLSEKEAIEYGRIIGRALIQAGTKWSV